MRGIFVVWFTCPFVVATGSVVFPAAAVEVAIIKNEGDSGNSEKTTGPGGVTMTPAGKFGNERVTG